MKEGGSPRSGRRLVRFAKGKILSRFVGDELLDKLENPIRVSLPGPKGRKRLSLAYSVDCLIELCDAILEARRAGALQRQQEHIAEKAELLIRAYAQVGIIGLIDESTGYQYQREPSALARMLEEFIAKELAPPRSFPEDFYQEISRLHGVAAIDEHSQYFAELTDDIIYQRLRPKLLEELESRNPKRVAGEQPTRYFGWLAPEISVELTAHVGRVIGLMMGAKTWAQYMKILDKRFPKYLNPRAGEQPTEEHTDQPAEEAV